jgi:ankyrin repeat protein
MTTKELHRAAENGDRKLLQNLLDGGANVNDYDEDGYTPLLRAVASPKADADFIRFLLAKGADHRLISKGYYKHDALAFAVAHLELDKVQVFLDAGADIKYVRDSGADALIDAAYSDGFRLIDKKERAVRLRSMFEFLLQKGVTLSGRTQKGQTALTAISDRLEFDAMQQLLRAGADEAQLKWTALHKAVAYGTTRDVSVRLEMGDPPDPKDHSDRTPLILAVEMGDVKKAELLWKRGADLKAKWGGKFSMLDRAIFRQKPKMIEWLAANGADVNEENDFGCTPLREAVQYHDQHAVKVLLAAGAHVNYKGKHNSSALNDARDREMIQLLLDAGADTGMLSNEGRRVLLGLPPDPEIGLLTSTPEEYSRAKYAREGRSNPEEAEEPFWLGMIRSGVSAYQGKSKYGDTSFPVWCAQRFMQSLTFLPDGRILLIGGEHEDAYMPDFHIYNDVFVFEPPDKLRIFLYPDKDFPPTDGHSATLVEQSIYIIGNVGHRGSRREGFTPVYRLNIKTMRIETVPTSGEGPRWISDHRARLNGSQIEIAGGKTYTTKLGKPSFDRNDRTFLLDLRTMAWRPAP